MKKKYQKPEVEVIDFDQEEVMNNGPIDGTPGSSTDIPPGWIT